MRFYIKLPAWFKVTTPIGSYNPDWAIVMAQTDEFGERGEQMYMVRETKGTHILNDLAPPERAKMRCGAKHFNTALDCDYKLNVSANELPGGTEIN